WILDELASRVCYASPGEGYGRRARGARQTSPNLARMSFSSDLFSPVFASSRWASSTGTDLFC
ncbi:hypothetical protein A2U01_0083199, partial [Trifolium medium]|nr:hypothetical protein [Trifolium medium]